MMTSSSNHNTSNEMVTISLFEQKFHSSSDVEFGPDSTHDGNGGPNPLMEYRVGRYNAMLRWIHSFMIHRPKLFSAVVTFIIFSLPFLISLIVILTLSHQNSSSSSSCQSTSSSDTWTPFEASSSLGAVSTDHPTCSQLGVDILKLGGNAIDAAIAAKLCLGVISPASSGIGGGALLLIHDGIASQNVFIDTRETAGSQAYETMFESDPMKAQHGGLAIAVPGEIMGLYIAWERYGSDILDWSDLVLPAALLAEKWVISEEIAAYINIASLNSYWNDFPALTSLYTDNKTGRLKVEGDTVTQPELSSFLRQLALKGPDLFYQDNADVIASEIQAAGGIITADDIRSYQPLIYEDEDLIKSTFMGYEYVSISGSSSGGAAVAGILNFMESYPEALVSLGNLYYHRLAEAFKHVFAVRLSLGDPDYVNTTAPINALLSDTYMSHLQSITLDDDVLSLDRYGGIYNITAASNIVDDHGTTHMNVVDRYGNAVAITSTINTLFGSKVVSPSTGILFNNEMDDFSIPGSANYFGLAPSPYNYPQPYKRPLSSMSPSFLFDKSGKLRLLGGASGGPIIITATAQVILNYIVKGMSLLEAVVAPRIHAQLLPDILYYENSSHLLSPTLLGKRVALDEDVVSMLSKKHHHLNATSSVAITQFIAVDPDSFLISAVSDPRKGGMPAGQ